MTATAVPTKRIGPYTAGAVPEPFTYQYLEHDGVTPKVITGWTATVNLGASDAAATSRSAVVTDGSNGKVTYTWAEGDIPDVGEYVMQFWVTDGDELIPSYRLIFNASESVGPVPDI